MFNEYFIELNQGSEGLGSGGGPRGSMGTHHMFGTGKFKYSTVISGTFNYSTDWEAEWSKRHDTLVPP